MSSYILYLLAILSIIVLLGVFAANNAETIDPCLEIAGNVAVTYIGDCTKFWRCYDKQPGKLNRCAQGTYFHPVKTYCTPDSSYCQIINQGGIGENNVRPTPMGPATVDPTTRPGRPFFPELELTSGACASCNGKPKGYLVPVTGVCEQFCVCDTYDNKKAMVVQTCPSKLYFNPTKRVCDWPLASGCTSNL